MVLPYVVFCGQHETACQLDRRLILITLTIKPQAHVKKQLNAFLNNRHAGCFIGAAIGCDCHFAQSDHPEAKNRRLGLSRENILRI